MFASGFQKSMKNIYCACSPKDKELCSWMGPLLSNRYSRKVRYGLVMLKLFCIDVLATNVVSTNLGWSKHLNVFAKFCFSSSL